MTTTASAEPDAVPASAAPATRPRRHWGWLLGQLVALGAVIYLCRAPLLTGAARGLVVGETPEQFSAIAILEGQRYYPTAAAVQRAHPHCPVMVFQPGDQRLEQFGVLPTTAETARRALTASGTPAERIEVLDCADRFDATRIERLGAWLNGQPDAQVLLLCDRFGSRRVRRTVDDVLGADAARVAVHGVVHPWYDEDSWWQRKEGAVDLLNNYVSLAYVWLNGPDRANGPRWNPDDYRRSLVPAP